MKNPSSVPFLKAVWLNRSYLFLLVVSIKPGQGWAYSGSGTLHLSKWLTRWWGQLRFQLLGILTWWWCHHPAGPTTDPLHPMLLKTPRCLSPFAWLSRRGQRKHELMNSVNRIDNFTPMLFLGHQCSFLLLLTIISFQCSLFKKKIRSSKYSLLW